MPRLARTLVACALLACFGTGCFGSFPLVHKVLEFNAKFNGKLMKTVVFWALLILPVYELAGLGDAFVMNLIEFWTGGGAPSVNDIHAGTGVQLERTGPDGLSVRVRRFEEGRLIADVELVRLGEGVGLVRRPDGTILSTGERLNDGSVAVSSGAGVQVHAARDVEAMEQDPDALALVGRTVPARMACAP